jgi:undecaprenyl-diphosphatase
MFLQKILYLDEKITSALRIHEGQKSIRPWAIFFAHSGDSWFVLLTLVLIWAFTTGEWHQLSALVAVAVVFLAVLVLGIKFSIRRRRPEGTWGAIYRNSDPHSFPSGHATRTTMIGVLVMLLGFPWVGVALILWAILVSLARVGMGVHYFSDIFAGFILGIGFAVGFSFLAPLIIPLSTFLF